MSKVNQKVNCIISKICFILIIVILCSLCNTQTVSATSYNITDLGPMGNYGYPQAISNNGLVVGVYSTNSSWLWKDGEMTTIPGFAAFDINDSGQVVGTKWSYMPTYAHAVFWQNGIMTDLGTLGGPTSYGLAINNLGQIAGVAETKQWIAYWIWAKLPCIWYNGTIATLTQNYIGDPYVRDINDSGQVVGSINENAVMWQNGTMSYLGTLGRYSVANKINNIGQVVGQSETINSGTHPFLWQNGAMIDLGTLGGWLALPHGINDHTQVVGSSFIAGTPIKVHAFLWQGGVMVDLNNLIPKYSGWELRDANDINNAGQIVGRGYLNGVLHGFLLTLVNESPPVTVTNMLGVNGNNGWFISDVTIEFTASSTGSGVKEIHYSIDGAAEIVAQGTSANVTLNTDGLHPIVFYAVDNAGNKEQAKTLEIKLDKTPPVITITGIENGATYSLGLVPTAAYTATDATSGLTASSSTLAGGDGLGLGTFTYTVTASDNAGNVATVPVGYNVIATPEGLTALIKQMLASGMIDNEGIANSLTAKVTNAQNAANGQASDNIMQAFINQVEAQAGQHISQEAAAVLINAAKYIIGH